MTKYPACKAADKYALDVTQGRIAACKWVKLACQRHLDDLSAAKKGESKYYFDSAKAERAVRFVELMPHTKGKWARDGKLLVLEPWQKFFVCCVFGWMRRKDDMRRFRKALLWVPRKNGKSALAAAIGNYMFAADNEYGAEVYSGATTEKQAWEVFRPAKLMASKAGDFKEFFGIEVNASNMNIMENGSRFEPIVGNPGDGSSPHCAIVDEYHEHKDDRLLDTMETGMGAREQPLLLMITTAGDNISGPCYAMQLDAQKMLEGATVDDQTFALIYTIDAGDDWKDIKTMQKANPNWGVSVSDDFLEAQLQQAMNNARKQSTFQTKHLNVWVGSRDAFYNIEKWRNCENKNLKLSDFKGRRAYIGLDLASRVDIAAIEILIPTDDGGFVQFGKHYLPYEAAQNEHYIGWMREGWLDVTDGEIIDFNVIKDEILELCNMFEVVELAYDPFQATMLITELMEEGVPVVEMRPTVLNFSEPMKELDSLIRSGRIQHNGDPVFTWMLSNVTAKLDRKDNVYPNKERPENKIDGPVALIMAIGRAMQKEDNSIQSAIDNLIRATY
jgi:phage terminase large subunit-like protein